MPDWFKDIWDSTERLISYSFWTQLFVVGVSFLAVPLTVTALFLTYRKDNLDRIHELEGQRELNETKAVAAKANERAAQLQLEAERLHKANLELQSQVELERTARLKIEERMRPRSLSAEAIKRIIVAMRTPAEKGADVYAYPNDAEVAGIARQIVQALSAAGWRAALYEPLGGGDTVSGMLVEYDPGALGMVSAAGDLANALRKEGLEVEGPEGTLPSGRRQAMLVLNPGVGPRASLRLTIGRK